MKYFVTHDKCKSTVTKSNNLPHLSANHWADKNTNKRGGMLHTSYPERHAKIPGPELEGGLEHRVQV